ncbi:MAG: ArnT family glycosyltransferase [Myxococcota bacterium]
MAETGRTGEGRGVPAAGAKGRGGDAVRLALLILAACALRAVLGARDQVIFNDGPHFLDIARAFAAGNAHAAMGHVYHPFYSWLIAQAYPLIGDFEKAGTAVSVVAGTLIGLPLWALLRDLFGRRVAWVGAVLWAVHPHAAGYAANIQSDSVFLLFFLTGVLYLWRGLERLPAARACAPFALAGIASALAYLTRPEGVGVVALGGLWLILGLWPRPLGRLRRELLPRFLAGCVLLVAFLLPAWPYLENIHARTGVWQLTQKKSLGNLVGVKVQHRPLWARDEVKERVSREYGRPPSMKDSNFDRYVGRGAALLVIFGEALTWQIVPFFLLGLAVRGRALWRTRSDLFLLSFFALYGFTVYRLAVTLGTGSKRHLFTLVLLGLGWAALGVVSLAPRLEGALARRGWKFARMAGTALLIVIAMTLLPKTLSVNAKEHLGERQAGEWIRAHGPADRQPIVFAARERITYYARARYLPVPVRYRYDAVIAYVRGYGADYIVTSDATTNKRYAGFLKHVRPEDLKLEASFPERAGSDKQYRVYKVLYPGGRPENPPVHPRRMWRGEAP